MKLEFFNGSFNSQNFLKGGMILLFNIGEYSILISTRISSAIKFFKKNCFSLSFIGIYLEDTMASTWDLQRGKFVRELFEMADNGCVRSILRRRFLFKELGEWSLIRGNFMNEINHIIYKAKEMLDLLDRCQLVRKVLQ